MCAALLLAILTAGDMPGRDTTADAVWVPDLERLQGVWAVQSELILRVEQVPPERIRIRFTGSTVAFERNGHTGDALRITLNEAKSPRTMDIQTKTWTCRAIYRLDGDALTICYNGDTKKGRPNGFTTEDENNVLLVCKRLRRGR
jgi:uncharacterized protein (TIGR03067 family)